MTTRAHRESATRVSGCVTALLREHPFFGSLALRLPIRPDPGRETLASDGREIRYSPDWVANTHADFIKTAIARVVLACALKHHTRRGDRTPDRWQHASQLVTHDLLQDAGFRLPPDTDAWPDHSVEQAYDRLPDPPEQPPHDGSSPSGDPPPSPASDPGAAASDTAPQDPRSDDSDEQQPHTDSDDDSDAPGSPSSNADSTGNDNEPDAGSNDPAGTGEVMDAPAGAYCADPPGAPDFTAEEQDWDEAMHQALAVAKAQGKLPGALAQTVNDAHLKIVDWRTALRRYMIDACRADYTWSRPNRRFIDSGLYLPSIHSEGIHSIAVFIDTSGSLPAATLADFWSAIRDLAAEIRPDTVIVLQIDTAVRESLEHNGPDLPSEISLEGRGGTDFRPGFDWLDDRGIQPSVCVYLTDMLCSDYPPFQPAYPVIWCNWGDPPEDWNREPWGERIDIPAAPGQ